MTPAQKIVLWADQLRDLAAMGLTFNQDIYNSSRYRTVQEIAMAMFALATEEDMAAMQALKAPIFSRPTPLTSGDAAIIDAKSRILLIQRADNGLWAMPGGALEVGETPAEGVVREAFEETGVQSRAVALVGVFDSRRCGTTSRHHLYHFTFLCQPLNGLGQEPTHANEILDVRWFAPAELPNSLDPSHVSRIPEAFRVWSGDHRAFFD